MREAIIQNKVLAVLNHRDSPCRLWRNNVGKYPTEGGGWIAYGLALGSADLIGIVRTTGQFLAVEIKTPVGRLSVEQRAWLETIRQFGGLAVVLRSVEEAEALVLKLKENQRISGNESSNTKAS